MLLKRIWGNSVIKIMQEPILELHHVSVHYGGVQALDGVSLTLLPGEVVALMGPNGAGKSTVLKAIFGLAPVISGTVRWRGEILHPVPHEVVEMGIAFVPQGRRIFTHLTVEENLEIGGYVVKDKVERRRRIEEIMDTFPLLKHKRSDKSGTLSGGQQQVLAIARGLMVDPKVLLLDEPSLGLAPKVVKEVFGYIKAINETRGTSILVVEHNLKSLFAIVDRAYILDKGKVIAEGRANELKGSDILERVLLGALT